VVTPAESFFVDTTTGPLCAGEADRARRWGAALGKTVALSGPAPAGSPRTRVPQGPSASRA